MCHVGFLEVSFNKRQTRQVGWSVLEEGSMPKVLAINVSKFTTSLYIAVEEL